MQAATCEEAKQAAQPDREALLAKLKQMEVCLPCLLIHDHDLSVSKAQLQHRSELLSAESNLPCVMLLRRLSSCGK